MNNTVHKRATTTSSSSNSNDIESTSNTTTNPLQESTTTTSTNNNTLRDPKLKKLRRIQRAKARHSKQQREKTILIVFLTGLLLVGLGIVCIYRILTRPSQQQNESLYQAIENEHAHTHEEHHGLDNNERHSESIVQRVKGWFGGGGGNGGTTSGTSGSGGSYKHDFYMDHVGDKTRYYAALRSAIDAKLPSKTEEDTQRMTQFAASIRPNTYETLFPNDMTYDIDHCPETPPPNYPHVWNVQDVLQHWPPDDVEPRSHIYQGLCRFDATREGDFEKAMAYRIAEVPFIYRNDPQVVRAVERWNQPGYLHQLIENDVQHRTEYSHNNHFMYWQKPSKFNKRTKDLLKGWKAPTQMIRMTFGKWLARANSTYAENVTPNQEHWYFRLIGCGEMGQCDKGSSEYLFDELSFFQPREDNPLYMPFPKKQKGIHCRFGMKGVIAENHFDGSRNMIVILGGERRYILSHPDQCLNLELLPRGHPSARHSEVDWSEPDWVKFPKFKQAEVNEVVMQAGDVLYLPTHWFHYIISLGLNYQCNTRSGASEEYKSFIEECGF